MAAPVDRKTSRHSFGNMIANPENLRPFGQFMSPQTLTQTPVPQLNQNHAFNNQCFLNNKQRPNFDSDNVRFERPLRFQSESHMMTKSSLRFQSPPPASHPRHPQGVPVGGSFERPPWHGQPNQEQRFNRPMLRPPSNDQFPNQQLGFNQQNDRPHWSGDSSYILQQFNQSTLPMQQNHFRSPDQHGSDNLGMSWNTGKLNPSQRQTSVMQFGHQEPLNTMLHERKDDLSENDKKWVQSFQKKQESRQKDKAHTNISISKAHDKTRHIMVLLAKLQKHTQLLETMKNEDASIWEQKLKEVMKMKKEVEVAQEELTNTETSTALEKKITKRRQKRARMKRLRHRAYEQRQSELTAREEKHAQIDKAMQLITEKQKLQKQEAEMQREGDDILGQVRRKLMETYRSQQLIEGLQTLRAIRADRLERQGVLGMYESQAGLMSRKLMFDAQVTNLKDLLCSQIKTYKAEESTLEVLLESEHQETREKEQEKLRQRLADKQKQELKREDQRLFGRHRDPEPGDPLYPFRQFYDAAIHSLEALVSIRRDWDMNLVVPDTVGASCIPDHYVNPTDPSSDVWNTALTATDS